MATLHAFWTRIWPPVPAEIRDELAVLRYSRLQQQIPILYLTLIAVILTAMMAAAADAPWPIRIGIPLGVTFVGLIRFFWWTRQRTLSATPEEARAHIRLLLVISTTICVTCSVWCIASWLYSAPEDRSYYPLFMAMGSLTTAFSLSAIRAATFVNLAAGIGPISIAMILVGDHLDRLAGLVVVIATLFLARMISDQHRQLVDLLLLKHQLREQANTDPLTGLYNRRALITAAEDAFACGNAAGVGLALVDLDGFKAVNDRHGHAAGDELLVQVAARMQRAVGEAAVVARLGGDEFALLATDAAADSLATLVDRLLAGLVPSFAVGDALVTLGASAGMASAPADGASLTDLFAAADRTLYAAKASRDAKAGVRRSNRSAA